jgi:hypothetical protein
LVLYIFTTIICQNIFAQKEDDVSYCGFEGTNIEIQRKSLFGLCIYSAEIMFAKEPNA